MTGQAAQPSKCEPNPARVRMRCTVCGERFQVDTSGKTKDEIREKTRTFVCQACLPGIAR